MHYMKDNSVHICTCERQKCALLLSFHFKSVMSVRSSIVMTSKYKHYIGDEDKQRSVLSKYIFLKKMAGREIPNYPPFDPSDHTDIDLKSGLMD